jgi:16S rRNA (uracil1498-N3)-methyltransferase
MTIGDRAGPRLYVTDNLAADTAITLGEDQAHYLAHVLRLKAGGPLRLFNGRDGEWRGAVSLIKKRAVEVAIREQLRPQHPEPDVWLCCAPIKRAHFDFMVMKATELGVSVLQPVLTDRTQAREVNTERCRAIAIEAAEQSERLSVPAIHPPVTLERLIANWPAGRLPLLCAEYGEAAPAGVVLPPLAASTHIAVITGPEGGFAPAEMRHLRQIPKSVPIRLGPRILRADTAALAAIACWQALCGDWR